MLRYVEMILELRRTFSREDLQLAKLRPSTVGTRSKLTGFCVAYCNNMPRRKLHNALLSTWSRLAQVPVKPNGQRES